MNRPGRKAEKHPEKVAGVEFGSIEEADAVRRAGGGPFMRRAALERLGRLKPDPIVTRIVPNGETIELRVKVPRSRLER